MELQRLRKEFEQSLDGAFTRFEAKLQRDFEKERTGRLYFWTRYEMPAEVAKWVKEELEEYHGEVQRLVQQVIEEEEKTNCSRCAHHRQFLEGINTRLKYPPIIDKTGLGPNNVFMQGFGAFGLTGGSVYVAMSYLPYDTITYHVIHYSISLAVGLFYGYKFYTEFERNYRKVLLAEGNKYLKENRKRIWDWFDQIIAFCEDEHKFYAM